MRCLSRAYSSGYWWSASGIRSTATTSCLKISRGAEADLRSFLRRIHHRDPERKRREALAQWLRALSPVLRGVLPALFGLGPGAQHAVRAVIAAVTGQPTGVPPARSSRRLVGCNASAPTSSSRATTWNACSTWRATSRPTAGRCTGAEVLLVRALLADISSYYGPVRRFNRRHPPLILLDNFHSPVGTYVRTPLARAYAATEGVRPVIVVTSLGRSTAEQRSAFVEGPRALATHHPPHVFLTLGIPRIETHVIGEKLLGYRAHSPHLPQVVAGLSGGRAGWASWLARELVPASTGEPPTETARPHRPSPRDPADEWVDIRARHAPLLPAQVTGRTARTALPTGRGTTP